MMAHLELVPAAIGPAERADFGCDEPWVDHQRCEAPRLVSLADGGCGLLQSRQLWPVNTKSPRICKQFVGFIYAFVSKPLTTQRAYDQRIICHVLGFPHRRCMLCGGPGGRQFPRFLGGRSVREDAFRGPRRRPQSRDDRRPGIASSLGGLRRCVAALCTISPLRIEPPSQLCLPGQPAQWSPGLAPGRSGHAVQRGPEPGTAARPTELTSRAVGRPAGE